MWISRTAQCPGTASLRSHHHRRNYDDLSFHLSLASNSFEWEARTLSLYVQRNVFVTSPSKFHIEFMHVWLDTLGSFGWFSVTLTNENYASNILIKQWAEALERISRESQRRTTRARWDEKHISKQASVALDGFVAWQTSGWLEEDVV